MGRQIKNRERFKESESQLTKFKKSPLYKKRHPDPIEQEVIVKKEKREIRKVKSNTPVIQQKKPVIQQKKKSPPKIKKVPNIKHPKLSKGEMLILIYLRKKGVILEQQKQFVDCKNILPLPFDFYLPEYNMLIEFDGEQHFKFNPKGDFIKTQEELDERQRLDKIKTEYCINNNIKLLRISYKEIDNIDNILSKLF